MEFSTRCFSYFHRHWHLGSSRRMHRELGFDPRTLSKLLRPQPGTVFAPESALRLFTTLWAYAALLYADDELERERAEVARILLHLVLLLFPPHPVVQAKLREEESTES